MPYAFKTANIPQRAKPDCLAQVLWVACRPLDIKWKRHRDKTCLQVGLAFQLPKVVWVRLFIFLIPASVSGFALCAAQTAAPDGWSCTGCWVSQRGSGTIRCETD